MKIEEKEEEKKPTGNVRRREISDEMRESFLDYAMSVIVDRALQDVRDGLKPVQRRILWAMWDSGLTSSAKTRKSATVVGEVLGRYHPHGDSSVYEAMVRLAQDFSVRYPLVIGQGNFGCFTKDTKVKLTDGRNLTFEELINEYREGEINYTYTINDLGLISVAEIKNPRLTRENAEIISVTLDNGETIKCTPNHLFMLKDGSYKEAQHIKSEDSLMPLYQKLSEKADRFNREGYVLIHQNKTNEWIPAHHLADAYNLAIEKYKTSDGRVRHHLDFNKTNNNPNNIARMRWEKHWRTHYEQASNLHNDIEYRKKIAAGRENYWSDPLNKAKHAKLISERNVKNWQNPDYREKMRRFLSDVNKQYIQSHPEKRKELSARFTHTLKGLWQNTSYRASMHANIIKGNKNHITNRTGKLKFLNVCVEIIKEHRIINEENYDQFRNKIYSYGAAPLWGTGLSKYFQNNPSLIYQEINNNHKIINIGKLGEKEDVFDMTIDNTHNFCLAAGIFVHNSIDGDSAAAYRYTEAKMSKIAEELLVDIDKKTVDFMPNFDGSHNEPTVLPAKVPSLLLNGAVGIAVGMATNIPPHNLSEILDASTYLIDNPDASSADLLNFVKGPDFPTGGIIYDKNAIAEAYSTGKGKITMRGVAEVGEKQIVITEIPYQVNKSELIIKMASLVQEKRIEGIKDIKDESDKKIRIVIDLKNDAIPQKILNQLFSLTDLQKDFHLNMLALAKGLKPMIMSLKDMLWAHIEHRREVIRRRTEFDLAKAKERAHILEGLVKAISVIDEVIKTIKKSANKDEARLALIKKFDFTEIQAEAILEMKLHNLAALEREKLEEELAEKKKIIKSLEALLKSAKAMMQVAKDEFSEIKEKFGDARRTRVVASGLKEFREEDLVPDEESLIALSLGGYIKRVPPQSIKSQHRGGKGVIGSDVGEEDVLTHFVSANTHDNILFFTGSGKVLQTKVYEIPAASRTSKGKAIHNFLELPSDESISAIVSYPNSKKGVLGYLLMATESGVVKKTTLKDFTNVRRSGIIAINLKKGDKLIGVGLTSGKDEVMLGTKKGLAIRFKESDVRPMSRAASGVRGINLHAGDFVSSFDIVAEGVVKNARFLSVMAHGYAKQTSLKEYKIQTRGGKGIITALITPKTGELVSSKVVTDETDLIAISVKGQILRTDIPSVRETSRAAQGVRLINLPSGDKIAGIICL